MASALAVATNLTVVALLYPRMGFRALALGTALGALLNASLLAALFERRVGGTFGWSLLKAMLPMTAAAAIMGGLVAALTGVLEDGMSATGFGARVVTGLGPVVIGVGVYAVLTHWWKVPEARDIWALVREHFRRAPAKREP